MRRSLVLATISCYASIFSIIFLSIGYYNYYHDGPPIQPIAFSHRIHVAKVGLPCNFCHVYADKSKNAGIPHIQKCMDCHRAVAVEKPEIKKLTSYWEQRKPIEWIKIYKLPDHVYFSHKRHIKKGVECSQCHGEVQVMDRVRRVRTLKMGWCVRCHRVNDAPTDCLTCHK